MAERVGFEPTVRCRITGFQDRLLKPLGHLSLRYYNSIAILFISCQLKIARLGQNVTQKKFARLHRRNKIFSSAMIRLVKLK